MSQHKNPWKDFASYESADARYFKGREESIAKFKRIMDAGTMSVLYASSGIGKTSFLQAGIEPLMKDKGYAPIHVLFTDDDFSDQSNFRDLLSSRIDDEIRKHNEQDSTNRWEWCPLLDEQSESAVKKLSNELKEQSLWWKLHAYELKDSYGQSMRLLLVFDQFEEVFVKFKAQRDTLQTLFTVLEELASNNLPTIVETALDKLATQDIFLNLDTQHRYKVVFSLRKEYLSDFDYWTNDRHSIAELQQNRMLLLPLSRNQAIKVITEQPREDGEGYIDTLIPRKDDIINKIDERGHDEVDPFILSVLCSRLYDEAVNQHEKTLSEIEPEKIIWNFYCDKINAIVADANHITEIENVLVDEEDGSRHRPEVKTQQLRNIQFEERYCQALEDAHLVRTDTYNEKKYVELSHDLLAKAIKKHREEEAKRQALADATHRLRLRQHILYAIIVALFVGSVLLAWFLVQRGKRNVEFALQEQIHTIEFKLDVDSLLNTYDWKADVYVYIGKDLLLDTLCIQRNGQDYKIQLPDSVVLRNDSLRVCVKPEHDTLGICLPWEETFSIDKRKKIHPKTLKILRNKEKTFPLQGMVYYLKSLKDTVRIDHAFVAYGNYVARTDQNGIFCIPLQLEDHREKLLGFNNLVIYKKGFCNMQYSVHENGKYLLPSEENLPLETIFENKRKAVDTLYIRMQPDGSTKLPLADDEKMWMTEISVLGNTEKDKQQLRTHEFKAKKDKAGKVLFSSINFLSRRNEKSGDRPVCGWWNRGNNSPYLFEGFATCRDIDTNLWHMHITCSDKQGLHTIEYLLVVKNPFGVAPVVQEIWQQIPAAKGRWKWEKLTE